MTKCITFKTTFYVRCGRNGRKQLQDVSASEAPNERGRVPRIARLMALAIRLEGHIRGGHVANQAELSRLGHVTRARVTQIMNLLQLSPDIQEALLFLPRVDLGKDPIQERQVRSVAAVADWRQQRRMWFELHAQQYGRPA
jgi:hypothetical protein